MAPKLRLEDINREKGPLGSMRVANSRNIVNFQVADALEFMAKCVNRPEIKSTALFIRFVSRWYQLMTSTNQKYALSKKNMIQYNLALNDLKFFVPFVRGLKVGKDHKWKPWQTHTILATKAILRLQDFFLNDKCYDFLLTSRFNQNCLENVFSVLRRKNPKPTAWALKYHLRSLDLSQFMIKVKGSSYDKDDLNHLVGLTDFIDRKKKSKDNIIRQKQSKKTTGKPIKWIICFSPVY